MCYNVAQHHCVIIAPHILVLEINFEESDYRITEGSDLSTLIRLQIRNKHNAFSITFTPVTIAAVEGLGLGDFINSETIEEESRATPGELFSKEM